MRKAGGLARKVPLPFQLPSVRLVGRSGTTFTPVADLLPQHGKQGEDEEGSDEIAAPTAALATRTSAESVLICKRTPRVRVTQRNTTTHRYQKKGKITPHDSSRKTLRVLSRVCPFERRGSRSSSIVPRVLGEPHTAQRIAQSVRSATPRCHAQSRLAIRNVGQRCASGLPAQRYRTSRMPAASAVAASTRAVQRLKGRLTEFPLSSWRPCGALTSSSSTSRLLAAHSLL
ncbi:hypothetical protein HPB50_015705 [Hyalomma asiaticum]|uniref:Uncharacterized protein n=1 Tax=Hyalomma asiaticum TaxID=266040 RepID=A0ACB7SZ01_HYAAI|nr:hypothetical protein HPB50_015705 [Hyalomma asiaticum]